MWRTNAPDSIRAMAMVLINPDAVGTPGTMASGRHRGGDGARALQQGQELSAEVPSEFGLVTERGGDGP